LGGARWVWAWLRAGVSRGHDRRRFRELVEFRARRATSSGDLSSFGPDRPLVPGTCDDPGRAGAAGRGGVEFDSAIPTICPISTCRGSNLGRPTHWNDGSRMNFRGIVSMLGQSGGERLGFAQEVSGGEKLGEVGPVVITGEPRLAPLGRMDLRVVPAQRPYGRLATALGGADRDVGGHAESVSNARTLSPWSAKRRNAPGGVAGRKAWRAGRRGEPERAPSGRGLVRRAATGEAARRRGKC
jgi:hypothetical protein